MKAVLCVEPGRLEVKDWPEPEVGEGEVLVRISRIGLCGTDYHIYSGNQPFLEYPRIMGHELSGNVVNPPSGSGFDDGDLVIINPYFACGKCVACRKDKPNCCTDISVMGVHDHGGMCEYVSVPQSAIYPAGNLSPDQAAMVEFLSIGAHAVRRGRVQAKDRVLVVGMGPIGLGAALIARIAGASVTVMDANRARVNKARDVFGFEQAVCVGDDVADYLSSVTDGEFFDLVYDATGNAKAMEAGFRYVAHGGTYVLVSVVKDDITFADPEFHKREMSLVGSRNATRQDFEHVITNIESGAIDTSLLHTHQCELTELSSKLPQWMNEPDQVIKAIAVVE